MHYDENFTKYLATTIGLTEALPEEINNQIRNAMTHLARAQEAETTGDLQVQIDRSISHIDRANRDCLKASIIVAREKMDSLIADAKFYHAGLTPDIRTRIDNIKKARRDVYRTETQGKEDVVPKLEELLRNIMYVSDEIQDQYNEAGKIRAKFTRFLFHWSKPAFTLVGIAVGYISRPFTQPLLVWFKHFLATHAG